MPTAPEVVGRPVSWKKERKEVNNKFVKTYPSLLGLSKNSIPHTFLVTVVLICLESWLVPQKSTH